MRLRFAGALTRGQSLTRTAATSAAGDTFSGVSMFSGTPWHGGPTWHLTDRCDCWDLSVRPVVGVRKTDRRDLWLEGSLNRVALEDDPDLLELRATGMSSLDSVSGHSWSRFGELGVGLEANFETQSGSSSRSGRDVTTARRCPGTPHP